jgi:predicted lipoprotein with Yx(FWY)xxD motif
MIGKSEVKSMRRLMLVTGMLFGVLALTPYAVNAASRQIDPDSLLAPVKTPPGIGKRVTHFGPAFIDKQGMTLYTHTATWPCITARRTLSDDAPQLLKVYAKSAAPFCTDQWPPLRASAEDKPVGDWTIIERPAPDVGKQWAYKGLPIHRFYRDMLPGDVNGIADQSVGAHKSGFTVAEAPLIAPPGVNPIYLRPYGVISTTRNGALYTLAPSAALKNVSLACAECGDDRWKPFPAGAMAANLGPWTVVTLRDGFKAWAFQGDVLYTYAFDQDARNTKGLGVNNIASLVALEPSPPAPRGFTVQYTLLGPTFADARGMTAYQLHCLALQPGERGEGGATYSCANEDTDPMYREMFCEAPDKCGERWRPVEAPADAQPQGGMWSVAVIPDKRYSLRWVQAKPGEKLAPGAVKVWTHSGRPIFTSAEDDNPGDLRGHDVSLHASPIWKALRAGEPEERGIAAGN